MAWYADQMRVGWRGILVVVGAIGLMACSFSVPPVVVEDLAVIVDLAEPDLAENADLTVPTDLATPPDLTPPPDLNSADLTTPPILTLAVAAAPSTLDLTARGPHDWMHLGLTLPATINRKNVPTPLLSLVTPTPLSRFSNNNVTLSWSDGTPTTSQAATPTGSYGVGVGGKFVLTVPASPTTQTLEVYVGGFQTTGRLTATLTGSGLPSVVDSSRGSATTAYNAIYTITFRASSVGQTLTVGWEALSQGSGGGPYAFSFLGAAL